MLSIEEAAQAHAMRERGWTISAIARHLRHDRKTIRAYLTEQRVPGHRRDQPDPFAPFTEYCRQRFDSDPHLPASMLFAELTELGFSCSYPTLTRALRRHNLRPDCEPCRAARQHKRQ